VGIRHREIALGPGWAGWRGESWLDVLGVAVKRITLVASVYLAQVFAPPGFFAITAIRPPILGQKAVEKRRFRRLFDRKSDAKMRHLSHRRLVGPFGQLRLSPEIPANLSHALPSRSVRPPTPVPPCAAAVRIGMICQGLPPAREADEGTQIFAAGSHGRPPRPPRSAARWESVTADQRSEGEVGGTEGESLRGQCWTMSAG
jgi:hypothetical protein